MSQTVFQQLNRINVPISQDTFHHFPSCQRHSMERYLLRCGQHSETWHRQHVHSPQRPNDYPPQCLTLLQFCKTNTTLNSIPYDITPEDFSGKIKSWRESTTTSPSGRHLGRYKTLYAKFPIPPDITPDINVSALRMEFETKQKDIQTAIVTIINYCLRTGYALKRWHNIVNAMIFKETGNYKIHRLQVIHIYEADFNLIMAVKSWRQLLQYASSHNLISDGLFGCRPGREAQSLTSQEELQYDISFTTRRSAFHFNNHAKSCYDRIVLALASLANR